MSRLKVGLKGALALGFAGRGGGAAPAPLHAFLRGQTSPGVYVNLRGLTAPSVYVNLQGKTS